jgi:hypothetical protein
MMNKSKIQKIITNLFIVFIFLGTGSVDYYAAINASEGRKCLVQNKATSLVVYYSRGGTTRTIAQEIA